MGDGSSEQAVQARIKQIRNMAAETEQEYEKEKLQERIWRPCRGFLQEEWCDKCVGCRLCWLSIVIELGSV